MAFRFSTPDPASFTACLELERGTECGGALHVLLMAEGEGGRVRIGAAAHRHVRVPNLEHDLEFILLGDHLEVRCQERVRGALEGDKGGFLVPFPPVQRFDLSVGDSRAGRPPFGLAIDPAPAAPRRRGGSGS